MTNKEKQAALAEMDTVALRKIFRASRNEQRTAEKPLTGLVHINGIGQVSRPMIVEALVEKTGAGTRVG